MADAVRVQRVKSDPKAEESGKYGNAVRCPQILDVVFIHVDLALVGDVCTISAS